MSIEPKSQVKWGVYVGVVVMAGQSVSLVRWGDGSVLWVRNEKLQRA